MKIVKVKNYDELSQVASEYVLDLVRSKPNATLGLATGSSPIGLYKNLIKAFNNNEVSFKDVKTYNLDEYCNLKKSHPESYYTFMHVNLFDHIDVLEENIHIPEGNGEDLDALCEQYNGLLHKANIDLQILGIGSNGHIGFNEPGTPFDQETFIVELAQKTREDNKRFFNNIDEVPTHAITMGIKNIVSAKQIVLVASGFGKSDAIYNLVNGPKTIDFPASILQDHPNVIVIVDEEAASKL